MAGANTVGPRRGLTRRRHERNRRPSDVADGLRVSTMPIPDPNFALLGMADLVLDRVLHKGPES